MELAASQLFVKERLFIIKKAAKRNRKHLGTSKIDSHFFITIGNRISSGLKLPQNSYN